MNRAVSAAAEGRTAASYGSAGTSEPLLDIHEVAARLNITVRHVRRLVAERRIPYLKVGSLLRFDPAEINAWLRHLSVRSDIVDLNRASRNLG